MECQFKAEIKAKQAEVDDLTFKLYLLGSKKASKGTQTLQIDDKRLTERSFERKKTDTAHSRTINQDSPDYLHFSRRMDHAQTAQHTGERNRLALQQQRSTQQLISDLHKGFRMAIEQSSDISFDRKKKSK